MAAGLWCCRLPTHQITKAQEPAMNTQTRIPTTSAPREARRAGWGFGFQARAPRNLQSPAIAGHPVGHPAGAAPCHAINDVRPMAAGLWCCRLPTHQITKAQEPAMNTQTRIPTTSAPRRQPARSTARPASYRDAPRNRDFGVGYGNSSGYASGKHYATNWANVYFRCG